MGSGAVPRKILVLDPMLGWANLPMVLCMIFAHGFGRDGFRSMVLDASACINMYCNIERNIMKNQAGSPGFWDPGENLYVYVFYVLCSRIVYFLCFRIHMQVISVWG